MNLNQPTNHDPIASSTSDGINDILLRQRKAFRCPGSGRGPSKSCICPKCGDEAPKIRSFPCRNIKCPNCGIPLCGSKKISKEGKTIKTNGVLNSEESK